MGYIVRIFTWLFRFVTLLRPFMASLFGLSVFTGVGYGVYAIYATTYNYLSGFQDLMIEYSEDFTGLVQSFFAEFTTSNWINLAVYVTALDKPINWICTFVADVIGIYLFWSVTVLVYVFEAVVAIVCYLWARNRIKMIASGITGYEH